MIVSQSFRSKVFSGYGVMLPAKRYKDRQVWLKINSWNPGKQEVKSYKKSQEVR